MLCIGIIKRCIEEMEKSDYHPYKIGAVIFKGNRIFSSGYNSTRFCGKIHPKYKHYDNALHAEQQAILNCPVDKRKGSSILVLRSNPSGKMSMAKPCEMCSAFIDYVGIKNVYYSNRKGEIVMERRWINV